MPDFRLTVWGHFDARDEAHAEAVVEHLLTLLEDAGAERLGATVSATAVVLEDLSTHDQERQGDDIGQ